MEGDHDQLNYLLSYLGTTPFVEQPRIGLNWIGPYTHVIITVTSHEKLMNRISKKSYKP